MPFVIPSRCLRLVLMISFLSNLLLLVAGQHAALEPRDHGAVPVRQMVPAQLKSPLKSRSVEGILRNDHEFHYLEDSMMGASSRSAASVRMSAKQPTLAMESLEDRTVSIDCASGVAHLYFSTLAALQSVHQHLQDVPEFFIVTSHSNCNFGGERSIYLVTAVLVDVSLRRLDLEISPMAWKDACHSVKVDFHGGSEGLEARIPSELPKRQNAPSTATAAVTTIAFPVPPSSQPTPAVHQVHKNIDISFQNTQILPPEFPGVDGAKLQGPFVPQGISFGCKNCTATGSIDLLQGEFSIAQRNETTTQKIFGREGVVNTTKEVVNFFESGFLEFRLDAFTAHLEFDSAVTASLQIQTFKIPFPQIPMTPFSIPGIATVGPTFNPNLVIGTKVASDLNFTYGFDLTIPDSTIIIDIGNITNSSITGFSGAKITALPFQSEFNKIDLTLSASFSPELLLGLSIFDGDGTAGAGAFLNLPTVSATLSQVSDVNSQCEPAAISTSTDTTNATADLFASLTHLTPAVNMSVGLVAEAEVRAGAFALHDRKPYTAFQTGFALPTACYSFDEAAKTYAPASAVVASATASAGAKALPGGGKSAAVSGKSNPLGRMVGSWGRLEATAGVLAAVFMCFLSL